MGIDQNDFRYFVANILKMSCELWRNRSICFSKFPLPVYPAADCVAFTTLYPESRKALTTEMVGRKR